MASACDKLKKCMSVYNQQNFHDGDLILLLKSYDAFITLYHETNSNHYIYNTAFTMTTKLGKIMTYVEPLPPTELLCSECLCQPKLAVWWLTLSDHAHKFIAIRVSMAIKLGKKVTYIQGPLPIELYDALIK